MGGQGGAGGARRQLLLLWFYIYLSACAFADALEAARAGGSVATLVCCRQTEVLRHWMRALPGQVLGSGGGASRTLPWPCVAIHTVQASSAAPGCAAAGGAHEAAGLALAPTVWRVHDARAVVAECACAADGGHPGALVQAGVIEPVTVVGVGRTENADGWRLSCAVHALAARLVPRRGYRPIRRTPRSTACRACRRWRWSAGGCTLHAWEGQPEEAAGAMLHGACLMADSAAAAAARRTAGPRTRVCDRTQRGSAQHVCAQGRGGQGGEQALLSQAATWPGQSACQQPGASPP